MSCKKWTIPGTARPLRSCGNRRTAPRRGRPARGNDSGGPSPVEPQYSIPEPYGTARNCCPSAAGVRLHGNPMPAGQGIARLRVVELLGGFPVREIVATLAVIAELALVRILVAGDAILGERKKGFGQILHLD